MPKPLSTSKKTAGQLTLQSSPEASTTPGNNLTESFRRLYFHLYTNSDASRAERIIEDIALVLLLKLAADTSGVGKAITNFRAAKGGTSREVLMPVLRKAYPDLVSPEQHFNIGDNALRHAFEELDSVNLRDAPAHALGEAFQALIGPRLRGEKGQFFTPRSLVKAVVNVIAPQPHESVLDPACGTGGFLVEAHAFSARSPGKEWGRIVGTDKDADLARLATALLRVTCGERATIHAFSSLDLKRWLTKDGLPDAFDVIMTNPPFGTKIPVTDDAILRQFDLGHTWVEREGVWSKTSVVASSQDPQVLFLELCIRLLKSGGRLGIVLPEGMFGNKGQAYVWQWLRKQGKISALLDCPRTTFQPSTDTKANVLFFERGTPSGRGNAPLRARISVALQCGHDRRGRSHFPDGRPYPDDFAEIGVDFHAGKKSKRWRDVELTRPDYLVPRYYSEVKPLSEQEAELTASAPHMMLGDLKSSGLVTIRKGHEVGSEAYGTGDIPFVRTSDVSNLEISTDPTKSVSDEIYAKYRFQQQLTPGNILMVVDGRYRIGTTAMLTENNFRCVVQSHIRIIGTPKPKDLDAYALLFALNLPSIRLRIRDLVFVQSTLGTLGDRLLELRIPILTGAGVWRDRVNGFRKMLEERDRLLAQMRTVIGPEFEL